jgi:UDP:flavonoid glycosyltransferase YjiC (YdhE family)
MKLSTLLQSCKIAITHAGAGTVLASLNAGVPLVLVPQGSPSQLRMAEACEGAGVGRSCAGDWKSTRLSATCSQTPPSRPRRRPTARQIAAMPAGVEVAVRVEALVNVQH